MRKRTIRCGLRMFLLAMFLIMAASFYLPQLGALLGLSFEQAGRLYGQVIFWGGALGGCGVLLSVIGLVRGPDPRDYQVRLMPLMLATALMVALFFYLVYSSFGRPPEQERLRPGETITI